MQTRLTLVEPLGDGALRWVVVCLVCCSLLPSVLAAELFGPARVDFTVGLAPRAVTVADIDGDGTIDRLPLFDDRLQDYFWDYDNKGLKLVQLRFYPVSTDTNQ